VIFISLLRWWWSVREAAENGTKLLEKKKLNTNHADSEPEQSDKYNGTRTLIFYGEMKT